MSEKELAAVHKRLDMALANLTALEMLVLAMFDAAPGKEKIISQFAKTSEGTNVEMLFSDTRDSFRSLFESHRKILLELMIDAARVPPS